MESIEFKNRKGIIFNSSVIFFIIVLMCTMFSYGYAESLQDTAKKQTDKPINLINALKNGLVTISVEGRDTAVKITVSKKNRNEDLNIFLPKGLTKFGFIDQGSIKIGGRGSFMKYTQEYRDLKLYIFIDTNKLDGDGFSVELDKELLLRIPKGESELSSLAKGSLRINVPFGYTGFDLSGMSGKIVEGEIGIEKNTFNKEKDKNYREFRIRYGNMKIKTQ